MRASAGLVVFGVMCGLGAADVVKPCSWTLYKQCDLQWAHNPLGTSSNTICSAGCAMSSVAMSLTTKGETIGGATVTPASLNTWLTNHGGYADEDLLVWNSVSALGSLHTIDSTANLSIDQLRDYVKQCNPVIANVRHGSHWVLVVGFDSSSTTFYVNDPGFKTDTYDYSDMQRFVVYGGASEEVVNPVALTASQGERADLFESAARTGVDGAIARA